MDREDRNKQLDREKDITVAQIKALSFDPNKDRDTDGVPDVLEVERLKADIKRDSRKLDLEERKLDIEEKKVKQQNKSSKK